MRHALLSFATLALATAVAGSAIAQTPPPAPTQTTTQTTTPQRQPTADLQALLAQQLYLGYYTAYTLEAYRQALVVSQVAAMDGGVDLLVDAGILPPSYAAADAATTPSSVTPPVAASAPEIGDGGAMVMATPVFGGDGGLDGGAPTVQQAPPAAGLAPPPAPLPDAEAVEASPAFAAAGDRDAAPPLRGPSSSVLPPTTRADDVAGSSGGSPSPGSTAQRTRSSPHDAGLPIALAGAFVGAIAIALGLITGMASRHRPHA